MLSSLVGSEMCIRDSPKTEPNRTPLYNTWGEAYRAELWMFEIDVELRNLRSISKTELIWSFAWWDILYLSLFVWRPESKMGQKCPILERLFAKRVEKTEQNGAPCPTMSSACPNGPKWDRSVPSRNVYLPKKVKKPEKNGTPCHTMSSACPNGPICPFLSEGPIPILFQVFLKGR